MLARPVSLRVRNPRLWVIPIAALSVIAAGCGGDDDDGATATSVAAGDAPATSGAQAGSSDAPDVTGELTIFADESLADAFTDVAEAFESEYEDVVPHTNFDSSNLLVDQIIDGTPADVFASADATDMDRLTDADLAGLGARRASPAT